MTGHIIVKKLIKTGKYKSALDYDKAFAGGDNPKGLFKMVVEPIENMTGQPEIRYLRMHDGIQVSGEGYIFSGASEEEIDEAIKKHFRRDTWHGLIQRQVYNEAALW